MPVPCYCSGAQRSLIMTFDSIDATQLDFGNSFPNESRTKQIWDRKKIAPTS